MTAAVFTEEHELYRLASANPDMANLGLEMGAFGLPLFTEANFMALILSALGTPYKFGGIDPFHGGADCSGLIYWAGIQCGVVLARTTEAEWAAYPHSSMGAPGRCPEFEVDEDGGTPPQHVGIETTQGTMIDDPHTGANVRYDAITSTPGMKLLGYVILPFVTSPTPPAPGPAPAPTEATDMMDTTPDGNGYWQLHSDGSVWSFGNAVYHGGCNNGAPERTHVPGQPDIPGPAGGLIPAGRRAVAITAFPIIGLDGEMGYWIEDDIGHIYSFGLAAYHGASLHS